MPVKIDFQVIASTGEDEKFKASELNYHGPTVRGWRSSVNCTFPQEIILRLKVLAILQQIQILAHQYLIPHKIEICTSSKFEEEDICCNSRDSFEYLGFITFSDNKATGFRSRELKSILIPSKKAKYIKLRIHNNHENVKNIYNQVGLMAVNILGNELFSRTDNIEMNNNINFHLNSSYTSTLINSNYISPYDDLAFQMSVDEETARIIKIIEYKMLQAVFEERLDCANALKITIENLRAAGEILGIYEQEKRKAINMEDFDRAKAKKIQIDNFRARIYNSLRVDKFLDEADQLDFAEEYDLNSNTEEKTPPNSSTPNRNSPRRDQLNRTSRIHPYENSPSKQLRPSKRPLNPLTHSQSQTFNDAPSFCPTPTFSTSMSNPHLHHFLKQSQLTIPENNCEPEYNMGVPLENMRTPSSVSDSLTGDDVSPPRTPKKVELKPVQKWNGSLIPRREDKIETGLVILKNSKPPNEESGGKNKIKMFTEQKVRSKPGTTNIIKSSFEAYEERMLPALKSYHGNEVVRECQFAFDQQRKSTLNEREKKQAMLSIAVFGIEMIEKFYSKSFNEKEEGLKQLQQELKRLVNPEEDGNRGKGLTYNKIARAVTFLLHRGLRDTVYSVYKLAAETVRLFFAEFVPQRVSSSEVARSVEKLLPELLTKSGEVTPRIHNMAAHTILSMAECDEVRRLNIIPTHLSRPLTSSVHPRLALSRLEMVEQLILNHGISKDKKSGMTCRTLAEFGSSGLHHPAEAVRKVSERILIHIYKVNPSIVRKQLPPDDNVTRRNLLYRQLFQEFDVMDVQKKLNEQSFDDYITLIDKNSYVELKTPHTTHKYSIKEEMNRKTVIKVNLEPGKTQLPLKKKTQPESQPPRQLQKPETHYKLSPKKEEKMGIKLQNGNSTLKFPSLTDSIRTSKAKTLLEQKKTPKINPQTGNTSLGGSITRREMQRDVHTSGIPVPTFGVRKMQTNFKKDSQTKTIKQSGGFKTKIPNKVIKIRMLDSIEDIKPEMGDDVKREMEESVKFSESMLASIRENEFTMSSLFNGDDHSGEKQKICIFCLSKTKWRNDDSLNKHYLNDCLMLTTCEYCTEVTEISGFTNHLLDDCKWKHIFQKCPNCREAILRDLYDKHECTALPGKVHKSRCPFCHKTIGEEETSWRKHLLGENTCVNHPRQK